MQDGQRVEVRLHGDDPSWYSGTAIKARKQWVQLDVTNDLGEMIADENSIAEWRPLQQSEG